MNCDNFNVVSKVVRFRLNVRGSGLEGLLKINMCLTIGILSISGFYTVNLP
jgi:hypothetical protein